MIEDTIITIVNVMFSIFLLPQVRDSCRGKHINTWTALLTAIGLIVMAFCFGRLGLFYSMIIISINCGIWFVLFLLSINARLTKNRSAFRLNISEDRKKFNEWFELDKKEFEIELEELRVLRTLVKNGVLTWDNYFELQEKIHLVHRERIGPMPKKECHY